MHHRSTTLFLVFLLSIACLAQQGTPEQRKPNIIFIMSDALRADHLGCYGYDLPTSPNLDRFAKDSTRFERAIAQASWTGWSVASLFTSRFPDALVTPTDELKLRPGCQDVLMYPTLQEILQKHGYATRAIIANPILKMTPGFSHGFDVFDSSPGRANMTCQETSPLVTDLAIARMQELKDRPFFLFLLYMDTHQPYYANPGFTFGDSAHDAVYQMALKNATTEQLRSRQQALHDYDSEIGYTDKHLGRFLDELKAQGLYDNTMIVFFGDHGDEFLEHGGYGHMNTLYQEVLSVPLIIKMPNQQKGRVVAGAFPLIDIMPSVLLTAGIEQDKLGLEGKAVKISALLRCAEQPIYSFTYQQQRCVISGQYKLIEKGVPPVTAPPKEPATGPIYPYALELYDLSEDPLERHNLAEEKLAIFPHLLELLHTRRTTGAAGSAKLPLSAADAELLKQLEALGYVNK